MAVLQAPEEWAGLAEFLSAGLDGRSRWRLPLVMLGMLFASSRLTSTTSLRTAGLQEDYDFLQPIGRGWMLLEKWVLELVIERPTRPNPLDQPVQQHTR